MGTVPPARAGDPWTRGPVALIGAALCLAALGLHVNRVARPMLLFDDFQILAHSWTWQRAEEHLWRPHNEHVMPLGRVSTWLLVQSVGRQTWLPFAAAWQGPLAVVLGMVLLYHFVRRELGHPLYGLIAMAFFGVTTQYVEAVSWFSASFALLALDTLLLGLLAAQRYRQTQAFVSLTLSAFACALSPCWFASGILAGPFCSLYLLPFFGAKHGGGRSLFIAGVPSLGTAAFLAVSVPLAGRRIVELEHYGGMTLTEVFRPLVGLEYTARSLVDNLLLGTFGIGGVNCPLPLVGILLPLLAVLALLALWYAPSLRFVVLGLAFILVSYVLIYSARSSWGYERVSTWGRYQLFPQLGLTLIVCGVLPRWECWLLGLSWLSLFVLARVFEAIFVVQVARGLGDIWHPQQGLDLSRVERVDASCREHGITADAARQALPPWVITHSSERVNAWELLHGSDRPTVTDPATIRRLLQDEAP